MTVLLVGGLGYGDEGKGGLTDFLTRKHQAPLVVRFNGGAQASHAVVTEDGRDHRFSQFGSGTFAGARTFLSRFMLVNPLTLVSEAEHLTSVGVRDPLSLLTVEEAALVTSPFHMAANRLRELLRDRGRHGSCGMGIGETMAQSIAHPEDALRVSDMSQPEVCHRKLMSLRERLIADFDGPPMSTFMKDDNFGPSGGDVEYAMIQDTEFVDEVVEKFGKIVSQLEVVGTAWLPRFLATKQDTVIFEGAQGVLLDQDYGWAPYNTWSDCTFANAKNLVGATPIHTKIGVVRGYMTRHGPGPFVTENSRLPVPQGEHNADGPWQRNFRLGHFDLVSLRYALEVVGGVDQLAITCMDHLGKEPILSCTKYITRRGENRASRGISQGTWDGILVQHPRPGDFPNSQQHRQETMGKILSFMRPIYETLPDVEAFIQHVEKELHTPVKLCSFGPKASDKRPR
jgi:adenylosuccinate synthase